MVHLQEILDQDAIVESAENTVQQVFDGLYDTDKKLWDTLFPLYDMISEINRTVFLIITYLEENSE